MTEVEALVRIAEALESIEFGVGIIAAVLVIGMISRILRGK